MDKRCDVCKQYSQGMTAIDPSVNLTCEHTSDLGLRGIKMPAVGCPECAERDATIEMWKDQWRVVNEDQTKHWLYTFAGQAMQGLLASEGVIDGWEKTPSDKKPIIMAIRSIAYAEALLAELEKREADNGTKK